MNQFLDSRLEALAFNHVSFGIFPIVNNIWTWVAVITAAVSFWRIRASGSAATSSCSVTKTDQKPSTSSINDRARDEHESRPILKAEAKPTPSALVSAPAAVLETSVSRLVCNNGLLLTKGEKFKLTVYCEDDDDDDGGESDVDGEVTVTKCRSYGGGDCKSCNRRGEWWESWERVLSVRMGEKGWYRYQDLTAINGNVVRLWDEEPCRRGRYNSSCAVW